MTRSTPLLRGGQEMGNRRQFLRAAALGAAWPALAWGQAKGKKPEGILVNDVHGQLSATRVNRIVQPDTLDGVRAALKLAQTENRALCICGGHSMGSQAFADDGVLVDTRKLARVLAFDEQRGLVEVEAGMQWPALLETLRKSKWAFNQKQTGVDRVTMGGSLSANMHGRGLTLPPFISDIESFKLLNARGQLVNCDRSDNTELFRLAIGGYGLFGVIYSVTLRLVVFSCYRPVGDEREIPAVQRELGEADWSQLLYLAHADKSAAFKRYSNYYLATNGQLYWSDEQQMSYYPENYHREIDRKTGAEHRATEVITEIYCEREALEAFMGEVRSYVLRERSEIVYGTIRLIEQDPESFLAWARKPYACVIFNLHVERTSTGLIRAADAFRALIDIGLRYGGSYYPTYHRYAVRRQVDACFPQFQDFLKLKRKYDPSELFQSDWYRHYKKMYFG